MVALTLGLGTTTSVVDRMLALRRRHRHLLILGMSARRMTRFGGLLFAVPFTLAAAIGFLSALVVALTWLSPDIPVPWRGLSVVLVTLLVVMVLGAIMVAKIGTRVTLRGQE